MSEDSWLEELSLTQPQAPATAEQSDDFCQRFLQRLAKFHLGDTRLDLRLAKNLGRGLSLTTEYSGMGTAEEAMRQITECLKQKLMLENENALLAEMEQAQWQSEHATDNNKHCRCVLMHHDEPWRAQCLFGDLQERIPAFALQALEAKRKELLDTLGLGRKRKVSAELSEAVVAHGRRFISSAVTMICMNMEQRPKGHCYRRGESCYISPAGIPTAALHLNCSGLNCYDWSTMGLGLKFLGESALPFAAWCASMKQMVPDVIIAECTQTFDFDHLRTLLQPEYPSERSLELSISPHDLGEPLTRNRKYMLFLSQRCCWMVPGCDGSQEKDDTQQTLSSFFQQLFKHQEAVLAPCSKFRAPPETVQAHVRKLAQKNHLPPTTTSGREWSYAQACTAATRAMVQQHKEWVENHVRETKISFDPYQWTTNLSQSPEHMHPNKGFVPALLRRSSLYLFGQGRAAVPLEYLECQGWNVFGERGVSSLRRLDVSRTGAESAGQTRSLLACFEALPQMVLQELAGNGMHLHVITAVVMFSLACVAKED